MITLKDIAKEAGVSMMTVSRVINKRYSEVSPGTVEKVEKVIQKMNYVPNSSARSLSSRFSRIISVIINGTNNPLESYYNAAMLGGIIQAVQEHGYNTMVHFTDEYTEVTKHLQSWKSEGAIFLGLFEKDICSIQNGNDIPLIFTDSYSRSRQLNNIGLNDYKGGQLAAQHLIRNGHRCMAFVSEFIDSTKITSHVMVERLKGFQETIKAEGLSFTEQQVFCITDLSSTVHNIIASPLHITGLFAGSDALARQLISELYRHGYSVPENYSVIGFDDFAESQFGTPTLTTIHQDVQKKARCCVDLLFRHLEEPDLPAQNQVIDVSLIERESVRDLTRH